MILMVISLLPDQNLMDQISSFVSIFDQIGDNVMITDCLGRIKYVNTAFEHATGYTLQEVFNKNPRILKSGFQDELYYSNLWSTILNGQSFCAQTVNRAKDGRFFVAEQTISPIKNDSGEITHFISIWRDVTSRKMAEERLASEKRKLQEIVGFDEKLATIRKFDTLVDFIVNKVTQILEADICSLMLIDEQSGRMHIRGAKGLSYNIVQSTRLHFGEFLGGLLADERQHILVTDANSDERFKEAQLPEYLGNSFLAVPVSLDEKLLGVITVAGKSIVRDGGIFNETDLKILANIAREIAVSLENIKLYKELKYLAVIDPLTNIHNYRHFCARLDDEINRCRRFDQPLTLMMIDIDDLKSYNDVFGHAEGDRLLRLLGQTIDRHIRSIDILCRYAGDEFALILPQTTIEGAQCVSEKIRQVIAEIEAKRRISVSIGIAQYHRPMSRHEFTTKAGRALFQAKDDGKNRIRCIA
jgi:diguanylate cyclase (GGDEF)-like protein/PAS domain S-box-containing protein